MLKTEEHNIQIKVMTLTNFIG